MRTTRRGTAPGVDSSRTEAMIVRSSAIHPVSWPGLPVPLVDRVTLASP